MSWRDYWTLCSPNWGPKSMTSGSLSLGEAFCCGDHAEQGQGERCRLLPSRPSAFLRSDWTLGGPERTPVDPGPHSLSCRAGGKGAPASSPGQLRLTSPPASLWASLLALMGKSLPAMQETQVQSLGWEDPLEKEMATHSSILAWRNPWQTTVHRSQRVRHS